MEVLSSPYWGSAQTLNSTQLSALLKKKDKPKSLVLKKLLKYVILLNIKKKMKTIDKDYPVIFYFLFLFFPSRLSDMPFWLFLEICVFPQVFLCHFMYVCLSSFMPKFSRLCISFCSYYFFFFCAEILCVL